MGADIVKTFNAEDAERVENNQLESGFTTPQTAFGPGTSRRTEQNHSEKLRALGVLCG
jgi:hypothetical protein